MHKLVVRLDQIWVRPLRQYHQCLYSYASSCFRIKNIYQRSNKLSFDVSWFPHLYIYSRSELKRETQEFLSVNRSLVTTRNELQDLVCCYCYCLVFNSQKSHPYHFVAADSSLRVESRQLAMVVDNQCLSDPFLVHPVIM